MKNLEKFVLACKKNWINEISLSWVNTDPLLYKYNIELIDFLRKNISFCKISLHTNWILANVHLDIVNLFDRVCISIPSLNPATYKKLIWICDMPNFFELLWKIKIPIKISTILTDENINEIYDFVETMYLFWIKRIVFRKLFNSKQDIFWKIDLIKLWLKKTWYFMKNRVYNYKWMQITFWDFNKTQCDALNLFANWEITKKYLLT